MTGALAFGEAVNFFLLDSCLQACGKPSTCSLQKGVKDSGSPHSMLGPMLLSSGTAAVLAMWKDEP